MEALQLNEKESTKLIHKFLELYQLDAIIMCEFFWWKLKEVRFNYYPTENDSR